MSDRHEPDHTKSDPVPPDSTERHRKHQNKKYRPRARSLSRPGPYHRSLINHPFMERMKASRLQTLGQKNRRGNYILETDPPTEERLLVHMHSHARWMAQAGVK